MWNQWMGLPTTAASIVPQTGTNLSFASTAIAPGMAAAIAAYPQYAQYAAMTTEQQMAFQQHWQQWQTYQQEYVKWQAQYGEQYNREMAAASNKSSMVPPVRPPSAPPKPIPPAPPSSSENGFAQLPLAPSVYQQPPPPPPPEPHPDDITSKTKKNCSKITGEPQLYNTAGLGPSASFTQGLPPMLMNQSKSQSSMNLNQSQQWLQNSSNQQSTMNFFYPAPNQAQWQQYSQNTQVNLLQPPPNFNKFGNSQTQQSSNFWAPPSGISNKNNALNVASCDQPKRNDSRTRNSSDSTQKNQNESDEANSGDANANQYQDSKNELDPSTDKYCDTGMNNSDINADTNQNDSQGNFHSNPWNFKRNNLSGSELFKTGNNRGKNFESNTSNRNSKLEQDNMNCWNNNIWNQGDNDAFEYRNGINRGNNFNHYQGPSSINMNNFGNSKNENSDNRWHQNQNKSLNSFKNGNRNFEYNDNNRWTSDNNHYDDNSSFNRSSMGFNDYKNGNINNISQNRGQQRVPELDEEEFLRQFKKWEEQYYNWKKDNSNHPDREMFSWYEQEFEKQRKRILERLDSIRRRKREQMGAQSNNSAPDRAVNRNALQINNDLVAAITQNKPVIVNNTQGTSRKVANSDTAQLDKYQKDHISSERENNEAVGDAAKQDSQKEQSQENKKSSSKSVDQGQGTTNSLDLDDKPRILSVEKVNNLSDNDKSGDVSTDKNDQNRPQAGPMKEIFKKSEGIPGLDLVEHSEVAKPKENATEVIDLVDDAEDGPTKPPKVSATDKNRVDIIPSLLDIKVNNPTVNTGPNDRTPNNFYRNNASKSIDMPLMQANPLISNTLANVADALKDPTLLQNILQVVLASAQTSNGQLVAGPVISGDGGQPSSAMTQGGDTATPFVEWRVKKVNNNGSNNSNNNNQNNIYRGGNDSMNDGRDPNASLRGRFNNDNDYTPSGFNGGGSNFGPNFGGGNQQGIRNKQQFVGNQNSMTQGNSGPFFNRGQDGRNFGGGNGGGGRGNFGGADATQCNGNNDGNRRDNPFRRNGGPISVFDDDGNGNGNANQRPFNRGPNNSYQGKSNFSKGPAFNNESDEFYRRAQVFDYSNVTPKVIDYGHKPTAIVSMSENSNGSSLTNEFRPMKTIDYGHAGNRQKPFNGPWSVQQQQWRKNKKNKFNSKRNIADSVQEETRQEIPKESNNKNEQSIQNIQTSEPKEKPDGQSDLLDSECFEQISDTEDDIPNDPEPAQPPSPPILSNEQPKQKESSSPSHTNAQNDLNVPSIHRIQMSIPTMENNNTITIDEILLKPGRCSRPKKLCIILRGPPASGKSYVAKLIKEKEVEMEGSNPRILSIDDYFLVENDYEEVCSKTGKKIPKKELLYEYDADMEETYMASLIKSFKKTIVDNLYDFIIVDCVNNSLRTLNEFYCHAKDSGFVPYIVDLFCDLKTCMSRNVHNRRECEINAIIDDWKPTPNHYIKLDISSLLENVVEMEDVKDMVKDETDNSIDANSMQQCEDSQEDDSNEAVEGCGFLKSKWENDTTSENLARLDGTNKLMNKRKAATMEDYLQVDDWEPPKVSVNGKKRVRWADIEEKRAQEKMRAIGFVVGQTDWKRMMDPNAGNRALNQTKYI